MALTLVSTVTVGSGGAASIEFTNIPQTGKDLLLVVSGRVDNTDRQAQIKVNGSLTATGIRLKGGASVQSFTLSEIRTLVGTTAYTSNTFGNSSLYFANYTAAANHSISGDHVNETNGIDSEQWITADKDSASAAITSIAIESNSAANFDQHSTASLYIIS